MLVKSNFERRNKFFFTKRNTKGGNMELNKCNTDIFFNMVYQDLLLQFPRQELKSSDKFRELLTSGAYEAYIASIDGDVLGYVILAHFEEYLWIDYVAILREFHSRGYGGTLLEHIKNNFKNYHGIFLEVEMENPKMANTLKRVKFYKNHGAKKLEGRYFYPNQYGDLQMDLYYIPLKKNAVRGYEIKRVIEGVFKLLHGDISHLGNVLSKIVF